MFFQPTESLSLGSREKCQLDQDNGTAPFSLIWFRIAVVIGHIVLWKTTQDEVGHSQSHPAGIVARSGDRVGIIPPSDHFSLKSLPGGIFRRDFRDF